jgi:cytochrome c nitrite reductase small subunit
MLSPHQNLFGERIKDRQFNGFSQEHDRAPASGNSPNVVRGWPGLRAKLRAIGYGRLALTAIIGALLGVGIFTFGYGQGASYLSSDPRGCINCHVMQDHFNAWQHSSHQHVAVCNDCHLPHHPLKKWVTKADNGFFHSLGVHVGEFS